MSEQDNQPTFSIEKLFVKDLSLEVPNAPRIYLEREAPQIEVSMNNAANRIDENFFEVVLTVTVTAKVKDKTVFLVEASYGGVFQIRNIAPADLDPVLGVTCPNILYPYLREVISDTVSRAGFPPVILHPMNFEAIYQARRQQSQSAAGTTH
ncbi:MAG TPA: protein-export chaperone SecB [Burkholderiales bacterium]|jgi:preprotein translocase subunit SecB|nr:protein-export chaperone SecB [Burkholderiales bacterium]